jgi:hypothetical protein
MKLCYCSVLVQGISDRSYISPEAIVFPKELFRFKVMANAFAATDVDFIVPKRQKGQRRIREQHHCNCYCLVKYADCPL